MIPRLCEEQDAELKQLVDGSLRRDPGRKRLLEMSPRFADAIRTKMETSPERSSAPEAAMAQALSPSLPKRRKTAYEARKERKRRLTEQVHAMQEELDRLKFQLLMEHGEVERSARRVQAANGVLHELAQHQHLVLANVQTQLTGHVQRSLSALQPFESVIRLGKDWKQRYDTLLQLKPRQLDAAERYLRARSDNLDPRARYCQEERFDKPGEDYSLVRFEMLPSRGVRAKDVFDAIVGSVLNAEMILSEMFGSITVREDTNFDDGEFSQIRLLSSSTSGAMVESNTVLFSKFVPQEVDESRGWGVMAANYVDLDELYPYNSQERVRRDTVTAVMVQTLSDTDKDLELFISRYTWLKIHRKDTTNSRDPERELQDSSVCYGDTARKNVERLLRVHVGTPTPSTAVISF